MNISARTTFIPPEDPARRFQRYANQTGQSPGQTGKIPPAGVSPTSNAPRASQKPSSVILPTRPVTRRPVGQASLNSSPTNRPTAVGPGGRPSKQTGSPLVPPQVPVEGKLTKDHSGFRVLLLSFRANFNRVACNQLIATLT